MPAGDRTCCDAVAEKVDAIAARLETAADDVERLLNEAEAQREHRERLDALVAQLAQLGASSGLAGKLLAGLGNGRGD